MVKSDSSERRLLNRVIPMNKTSGISTYDCVRRLKKLVDIEKIGHAGSLDPLATGLVLILTGEATKLSSYLMDLPKRYIASVQLGRSTDTQDAEGSIVAEGDWGHIERKDIEQIVESFVGKRKQVPPMYSALKHKGTPLYVLARRGKSIERKPRDVEIYELELIEFEPPLFTVEVYCSRGLYVRALAEEIGAELGVPAHLHDLERVAVGHFTIDDTVDCDSIDSLLTIEEPGYSMSEALKHLPTVEVTVEEAARLSNGIAPRLSTSSIDLVNDRALFKLIRPDGSLGAIAEISRRGEVSLKRVFG